MGQKKVDLLSDETGHRNFLHAVLTDLEALQQMLDGNLLDGATRHIGAEQELCLVDRHRRPAPLVMEILRDLDDPHFTTEIARFNVEFNLDPLRFTTDCLSIMHDRLNEALSRVDQFARKRDAECVMVGILPTISRAHLSLLNMTPEPRYMALNKALNGMRGEPYEFHIEGDDELHVKHNSVMMEACTTSFQVHLQIEPQDLVDSYNFAQLIAAPVLAMASNSPYFLGHRLWQETRIALFQQATDIRKTSHSIRERSPRVTFGKDWVRRSILEVFQDDIARHQVLLGCDETEDSVELLNQGSIPRLRALSVYNGTLYRWNRLCYGITDGKPHLRIENRMLPSGPTVVDEVANAAFWLGLMNGMPNRYRAIASKMNFDDARHNFYNAARLGLEAQLHWVDGNEKSASTLILNELLPIAQAGLEKAGIDAADVQRYLEVIEGRARSGITGSQWMQHSIARLRCQASKCETAQTLTSALMTRQKHGEPVHQWAPLECNERCIGECHACTVEQLMSTDLFAVCEKDEVKLAANIMTWKEVRHIPVEDHEGQLVGLITTSQLLQHYYGNQHREAPVAIRDIMIHQPVTAPLGTTVTEAAEIIHHHKIGCLPIVDNNKLVGIVTKRDFLALITRLLQRMPCRSGKRASIRANSKLPVESAAIS